MKWSRAILVLLGAAFVAAGALALLSAFRPAGSGAAKPAPQPSARVAWRVPVSAGDVRPCPAGSSWVLAGAGGAVEKISAGGQVLWRSAFSNESFSGASAAGAGLVVAASDTGRVFGLDAATGAARWRRETDGRFRHAPLTGQSAGGAVLWLVSQEDGRLFCLRASDGAVLWTSEATNRCDGEPVAWPGFLAYGNCDGAVYVFSAADGKPAGTIAVGDDDQMAGGVLAMPDGRLVTGTRQGNLAVVNPLSGKCEAKVKVSESEAFVTPVAVANGLVAMGTDEGQVTLWRLAPGAAAPVPAGRAEAGAPVKSLAAAGGRIFALAGGALVVLDSKGGLSQRLALGDEAGPLAVSAAGELACVADGALVCVKGGAE